MGNSLKNEIIKLRLEGKTYDQIKELLNCSKSTISYHCKNNNINDNGIKKLTNDEIDKMNEYYLTHTITETAMFFGVSESTVKNKVTNKHVKLTEDEKKKKNYSKVKKHRLKIKTMAVDYKGGSCVICGYKKCLRALEFHHINPSEKDFGISAYSKLSWDIIKPELDKCILVCSNCHAEIHDEIDNLGTSSILNDYLYSRG